MAGRIDLHVSRITQVVAETTLSENLVASLKETFGVRNEEFALAA